MIKHSTHSDLLSKLLELLDKHRSAFRQERSYWRVVGLVLGELFNFGRHTVTQGLMGLGLTEADWSGWYRLFSRGRYAELRVARLFFRETLPHTAPDEPYVVGVDGVQIPRSSLKLAGTSWLKAPRTPVFKVGIHRAQRFVHGAWLTPLEAGYSRAVPLRFLPAFPPKAKPAPVAPALGGGGAFQAATLAAGRAHTCAARTGEAPKCFGANGSLQLGAATVPAGLAAGLQSLRVEGPYGTSGELPGAFTVEGSAAASLSAFSSGSSLFTRGWNSWSGSRTTKVSLWRRIRASWSRR